MLPSREDGGSTLPSRPGAEPSLVELASGYGEADIRRRLHVTLLESGPRILGAFPEKVSISAESKLRELGVYVRTGVKVLAANEKGYLLEGG